MVTAAITQPIIKEGEADLINALFGRGLSLLHIRKPHAEKTALISLIERIDDHFYDRISIHYNHDLAREYNLGGIHLSGGDRKAPEWWMGRVSASCHSIDEIASAPPQWDYMFLSPIFDSVSKKGYASAFSTSTLAEAQRDGIINSRIYALGGITPQRLTEVSALGFGGVAVLGYLWENVSSAEEMLKRYDKLLQHF